MSDVIVNISNTLAPVRRADFGRALILASTDPAEGTVKDTYKLYEDTSSMSTDFPSGTDVYKMATALFAQTPRRSDVAVFDVTRDASSPSPSELSAALDALVLAGHTGWYFLLSAQREQVAGDRDELADWVSAQERMAILSPKAEETVAEIIAAAASYVDNRVLIAAHKNAGGVNEQWFDAALAGRVGAKYPGSINWRHLMLNAVTDPGYNTTELADLTEGNVTAYWSNPVGHLCTTGGMTTSGFWADLTRAIDFLTASIRERIWDALAQKDKIPFTDSGILYFASLVETALQLVVGHPYYIIADDLDGNGLYQVKPPRREDLDPLDVKNRILADLPFWATVAGAINQVTVNGVLTEEVIEPVTGQYN